MIGLCVVTYNRLNYLKQCMAAIEQYNAGGANYVIIVDDCSTDGTQEWLRENSPSNSILKEGNRGVANSKNIGIRKLIEWGCEHVFVIEDDILLIHSDTCLKYVEYAQGTGLHHLSFALHGPLNIGRKRDYNGICVYPQSVGAFCYYSKLCIERIGYMDERLVNAYEHIDHTKRIADAGLSTPMWYFADHPNSDMLLQEIEGSIDGSSIRPRDDWRSNIDKGKEIMFSKHGPNCLGRNIESERLFYGHERVP